MEILYKCPRNCHITNKPDVFRCPHCNRVMKMWKKANSTEEVIQQRKEAVEEIKKLQQSQ